MDVNESERVWRRTASTRASLERRRLKKKSETASRAVGGSHRWSGNRIRVTHYAKVTTLIFK